MTSINQKLIDSISGKYKNSLGYYPDMLVWQHDKNHFEKLWWELAKSPYIYTDGYDLEPASLLGYLYETVKGWLGFTNHCQENLVQLCLQKYAFYGYVRGYTQDEELNISKLPTDFQPLVKNPCSSDTSTQIQQHLITYYVTHAEQFPRANFFKAVSTQKIFGDTFRTLGFWTEIPALDPQNPQLIDETRSQLEAVDSYPVEYPFLRGSRYSTTAAAWHLEQALKTRSPSAAITGKAQQHLQRALDFEPNYSFANKEIYIQYYLTKKDFLHAFELIVTLDDQVQAMRYLTESFSTELHRRFVVPASKLGVLLGIWYLEQAQKELKGQWYDKITFVNRQTKAQPYLEEAFYFHPNIVTENKLLYINYFLEKKDFANACHLLNTLENITGVLTDLCKKFPKREYLEFVEKDSKLALALTKHYLQQDSKTETIERAMSLDSNLAEHNPVAVMKQLVSEKKYPQAMELFKNKKDKVTFLPASLSTLANHFNNVAESLYQEAKNFRDTENWSSAKTAYFNSLQEKQKAYELEPSPAREEEVNIHKRLYARILIDADIKSYDYTKSDLESIIKAIRTLDTCNSRDKKEQILCKEALVKGLMRQVDCLTWRFSESGESHLKHVKLHQSTFNTALKALERVVDLLKDTKDKSEKLILGKAYFLLGDINYHFDLSSNYPQYFRQAMQTVPHNPYYILRCSEVFKEETRALQQKGVPLLKQAGFEVMDYHDWDNDRWNQSLQKVANIKDIHAVGEPQTTSVRTLLSEALGFRG